MYYIGVDLGGTNICVGLVSENGKIISKKSRKTLRNRGYSDIIKDMSELCIEIIEENNFKKEDIHSIGVGVPGTINPKNVSITYACNLNFRDVELKKEMQRYISLPIYVDNDANCAALGESLFGAAKGSENSITITIGTGIGSGIIINNKIYSGSFYGGAEIGHMVIKTGGNECTCGRKGCWETYASATAIIKEARKAIEKNKTSKINDIVKGNLENINAKVVFDAYALGDAMAKKVIQNYINDFAEGLANVINIFQPEVVVVGGGVSAQGDVILKPITEIVKTIVYGGVLKTKIIKAELGNDAGIIGAAMLSKQY